jgi:hypothetical protein
MLYLNVTRDEEHPNHIGVLYRREWKGRPLSEGDPVAVCYRAGDDEWFGEVDVRRIYLHADGSETVDLVGYHIDPSERVSKWLHQSTMPRVWRSEEGDLHALLEASGWQRDR